MSKTLYIVVRKNGAELAVCSDGQKPFIGGIYRAKDVANFLKSVNPGESYEVMSVGAVKHKGVVTERYSAEKEGPTKNAKKRTGKCDQGVSLRS